MKDYAEAIRLEPRNASFRFGRGVVYGYKEDYDNAIEDYTEAVRLDPKYANAFQNRGMPIS